MGELVVTDTGTDTNTSGGGLASTGMNMTLLLIISSIMLGTGIIAFFALRRSVQ